ncbi:hypothetical protein [Flavobacterium sp.]|uniref:hypothetical protein n=1 Tax=Flavobacterium sp. TaxID=239 RepID=UPI0026232256|nr:hypothetical protein [Flavobacterium sp.]
MKKIVTSLFIVSVVVFSCKKEEEAPTPKVSDAVSVFSDSFSGPIDTVATTASTASVATTTPAGTTPAMAQPVATAKGMNPAHGQPGHRCDIAVGAPLNSPPGKVNATKPAPITKTTTISSNAAQPGVVTSNGATITTSNNNAGAATVSPIVTPEGMNPPHGQAGHDCAVAVGAPLPKK